MRHLPYLEGVEHGENYGGEHWTDLRKYVDVDVLERGTGDVVVDEH